MKKYAELGRAFEPKPEEKPNPMSAPLDDTMKQMGSVLDIAGPALLTVGGMVMDTLTKPDFYEHVKGLERADGSDATRYIVEIPKAWIEHKKLQAGDRVHVNMKSDMDFADTMKKTAATLDNLPKIEDQDAPAAPPSDEPTTGDIMSQDERIQAAKVEEEAQTQG